MKNLRKKQTIATNNRPQTQNLSDALLTKVAGGQGRSARPRLAVPGYRGWIHPLLQQVARNKVSNTPYRTLGF